MDFWLECPLLMAFFLFLLLLSAWVTFLPERVFLGFWNFAWAPNSQKKLWTPPSPCTILYFAGQGGVFSKVVQRFWIFGYDFWGVGGDVSGYFADTCAEKAEYQNFFNRLITGGGWGENWQNVKHNLFAFLSTSRTFTNLSWLSFIIISEIRTGKEYQNLL